MLRRIASLYRRYAQAHFQAELKGFDIRDEAGRVIGRIDRAVFTGRSLRVAGWALTGKVTLHFGAERASMLPTLPRRDVAEARGIPEDVGFDLSTPRGFLQPGHLPVLQVDQSSGAGPIMIGLPMPASPASHARLAGAFAVAAAVSIPPTIRWFRTKDPAARAKVQSNLGLEFIATAPTFDPSVFPQGNIGRPAQTGAAAQIAIILPVYNAFDLLPEVIDRVIAHTDLPYRLIVIDDCSPDERVRPWLRERLAAHDAAHPEEAGRIELIENEENLGFIGAVNRGLSRAAELGRHAVLLNSDAFVPPGWASRLFAPIVQNDDVATVTPFSNDAEIFSAPALCKQTPILPGMADRIDETAQQLSWQRVQAPVPTGMGFCMAMNRRYLADIPALDTAFGKGYGEEVDWCRKALAKGGEHVALAGLFVEHRGGESFGSATKLALVAKNNALIEKRYPGYDLEVQRWLAADPLRSARMALAVAWAGAWSDQRAEDAGEDDAFIPIYLAHVIGGGAENWLTAKIEAELEETGRPAIVLRVGGGRRWMIDVMSPKGKLSTSLDDMEVLLRLLQPLRRREVIYSCGVGDMHAPQLPGDLLAIARAGEAHRIEVLFHDFYPLSPSYTLLDGNGRFTGAVPAGHEAEADKAHSFRGLSGQPVSLAEWRAAWTPFIDAADRLTCFSEDSATHVAAAYPQAKDKIGVVPHVLLTDVPRVEAPAPGAPRVIGVLGNIGYHKGAKVISSLGDALRGPGAPKLVVIGNVDPAYAPPVQVHVHGDYRIEQLPALVERYGITEWFIPSIWPETFSYTTHEALATGLPVWAFSLGAQGAAVGKAPNGRLIPFPADEPPERAAIAAFADPAEAAA
ncbi:glycosyltransferase [Pseudoroseicyclus tamaricis]|uniref:Glycosyltransferase n=1 Tax=Pseudoroseicyclus tamaricis TaxID=2705421 RepID=A0A6B2K107_9RHOB|nr:glycosyltransferase [Pseudoroseicyclus tamaricis]NDV02629.1 glycosyltransferase [Pseudoroseicyclus tamaricis]